MLKTEQDSKTCRAIGYGIAGFIVAILAVGMFGRLNPVLAALGTVVLFWIGITLVHGFCVLSTSTSDINAAPPGTASNPVHVPFSGSATIDTPLPKTVMPQSVQAVRTAAPGSAGASHWSMAVLQKSPLSAMHPAGGSGARGIQTTVELPGESELRNSVGSWRYTAPVYIAHGRPVPLSAPRGGAADDLTVIKGVGPKLEALLHRLGIFHFDQIANWTETEIAWVDDNLEGFKGRVTRDHWVAQAAILAAGGKPEDIK